MSECASTVTVEDELLSHLDARSEPDGRLAVRGGSLFTGYATEDGLVDPKLDGWFVTEDFGEVEGRRVRVRGRAADFVKIRLVLQNLLSNASKFTPPHGLIEFR